MYALRESETLNYLLQWCSGGVISAPTGHVAGTLIVMTWGKGTAVLLASNGQRPGMLLDTLWDAQGSPYNITCSQMSVALSVRTPPYSCFFTLM